MENTKFLVLDGGLGYELIRAGFDIEEDPLWGGKVIIENPEAIKTIHKSFLESGANVVITSTYQVDFVARHSYLGDTLGFYLNAEKPANMVTIEGLCQHYGLDLNEAVSVIHKAVKVAQDACDEVCSTNAGCKEQLLVAGSVGAYGACQHDKSEYSGDYVDNMTVQELMDWHRPRIDALLQTGVDILALETIPAQKEAEALVKLLKEFPTAKAWLALSCRDESHTCHGEMFSEVVHNIVRQSTQIVAVGVNCTSPLYVKPLLQSIEGKVDLPLVVYPNSGEFWKDGNVDSTGKTQLHSLVDEWIEAGARWIGGCCRTEPEDIAKICEVVDKHR